MAQKDSGAHPDHAGVDDRAGGPTERWVDVHSNHGGASHDDGDVPATAVDKMVNQLGTKHHGITKKLKQGFTRSEAHRRALATTVLARRRFCRPRGRKAASGVPRQNQVTKAGWLGAQGIGEAGTDFAETATVLGRRRKLDEAAAVATGKAEELKRRRTATSSA